MCGMISLTSPMSTLEENKMMLENKSITKRIKKHDKPHYDIIITITTCWAEQHNWSTIAANYKGVEKMLRDKYNIKTKALIIVGDDWNYHEGLPEPVLILYDVSDEYLNLTNKMIATRKYIMENFYYR
eukprot:UN04669